ncbi:MAG: anti-sigma factor antagonist [Ilumatobacteraceae bacterium]|jgi:anti-anti-sigma factor
MTERLFHLRGEIDRLTVPTLQLPIVDAVAHDSDLVVDCSELTFIDSSGLNMLVKVQLQLQAHGHNLRIVNASPTTERVLLLSGLSDFFHASKQPLSTSSTAP